MEARGVLMYGINPRQISKAGYFYLGGCENPRLFTRPKMIGGHVIGTYYYCYEFMVE